MKFLSVIFISTFLSGCAGVDYILTNYDGIPVTSVTTKTDTFRVFDRPRDGKMMITPSYGATAIAGLTWSSVVAPTPKPVFQEAVEAYLVQTGRSGCKVTDGYLLVKPQWEFKYDCGAVKTG